MHVLARNRWAIGGFAALIVSLFVSWAVVAKANPLDLITTNTAATTTVSYMTAGTATTTYTYDAFANSADPNAIDKAAMLVQFTASSTSSKLSWTYEYSQDGVDWYADTIALPVNATNTQQFNFTANNSGLWNFASSSQSGAAVSVSNNRGLKVLWVPTPTRFTRVTFTVPVGAAAGGVWATFVAQKQQP